MISNVGEVNFFSSLSIFRIDLNLGFKISIQTLNSNRLSDGFLFRHFLFWFFCSSVKARVCSHSFEKILSLKPPVWAQLICRLFSLSLERGMETEFTKLNLVI